MQFKLNRIHRLIANAAAKDKNRPALHCVHIRKGTIEAANGYILMERKVDYDGEANILLDIKDIANHKDAKGLNGVVYTGDDKELRAIGQDQYIITPKDGSFPKTEALYPTNDPVFRIALSKDRLLEMLKCLDKGEDLIKFYFYGADKPARIVAAYGDVQGLIMPMKAELND